MASDSAEELILVEDEVPCDQTDDRIRCHCVTTWKIKNFSCCQLECGEELFSPLFSADSSARLKWYLSVFPNGQTSYKDYVSIHVTFIRSAETDSNTIKASCKVSIINFESNVWICDRIDQNLGRFQFNTFVNRKHLFQEKNIALPQDTLTIRCQFSAFDERVPDSGSGSSTEVVVLNDEILSNSFSDDFKRFYERGKFCDVTLKMRDGSLSAHRVILMARSPVFAELLGESQANSSIVIPDFNSGTMRSLLTYIYCGQIDSAFPALALDLYEAAEKYKIRELKDAMTPNRILAHTEVTNETFTYTWRVKNFSSMSTDPQKIRYSEKFHTGPSGRSWSLSLCFHKCPADDDDRQIGIYLNKLWTTGAKKAVYMHFSISLLDKEDQPRHTVEAEKLYKHSGRYGFSNFMKRSVLLQKKELLPGDSLTIRCDMKICDGANSSKVQHSFSSISTLAINDVENLSDCFRALLLGQMNCDVTVCATERKFRLHKSILCARSTVFAEFFDRYSNGLNDYTVNIQGIKAEILKLLFMFIYTDKLEVGLSCNTVPNLYAAAEHYKILRLKTLCSDFMKSNPGEVFISVNQSSDDKMKELVKDFICSNADDVLVNVQWADFARNHPGLSREILQSLRDGYREAKRRRIQ